MRSPFLAGLLLLAFTACGGKDATGPTGTSVNGTWKFDLTDLQLPAANCTASTTMTLSQQGSAFSGSYTGGRWICSSGGTTDTIQVGGGAVVHGTANGASVAFDFDNSDSHHSGSISGDAMSGVANYTANSTVYIGHWQASRQ